MSAELVKRLREVGRGGEWKAGRHPSTTHPICTEAADLIEFQGHENKRLIAEVMLQMRWKTDTQQYADKLEAEIERLRGANKAAAECVAAMTQECARYRNEIRNALENKP